MQWKELLRKPRLTRRKGVEHRMAKTIYKGELVKRVAKEERLTQRVVQDVITSALKLIQHSLAERHKITFPGFGTFYTRMRGEGTVRNIRTGEPMTVPARRVAAFRAGELLKAAAARSERAKSRGGRKKAER